MNKKLSLSIFSAALLVVACNKPMAPLTSDNLKVTPNPLQEKAGKVTAAINGNIPAKYFEASSELTITPIMVFAGTVKAGSAFTLQGEKVQGNNKMISNKEGGAFDMTAEYAYEAAMAKSELFLDFKVTKKDKSYTFPRLKVADGVVATSTLAGPSKSLFDAVAGQLKIAPDAFQKVINEKVEAQIMFLIQQANVRQSESKAVNKSFSQSLKDAKADKKKNIKGVEVASYASPDGGLDLNEKLAQNREKSTTDFLNKELKKNKISDVQLDKNFTAEDWDGFKTLVENSNIQDKDLIIRVLSTYSDPAEREAQIKNMSATFKALANDVLPQLRRSRLTATIEVMGKTDEELTKAMSTDPKSLNIEEILYSATLATVNNKVAYQKAIELYPQDARAYNNLGVLNFKEGNIEEASKLFQQALSKDSKSKEAKENVGYYHLVKGDSSKAVSYFTGSSFGLSEANGINSIKNGDYAKAVNDFGSNKTNNAGLAQILNGDYSKAKATLSGVSSPDATTNYLLAVVGARTNSESMVIDNLKASVKKDSEMAKKAATDIEFAKFAANSEFAKTVK